MPQLIPQAVAYAGMVGTGGSVVKLHDDLKPKLPSVQNTEPAPAIEDTKGLSTSVMKRVKKKTQTLLTSSAGDLSSANVSAKTLLGQ